VAALRARLDAALAASTGAPRIVVFGCEQGADVRTLAGGDTVALPLLCAAQLAPSFVEYALRTGAQGVLVAACRPGGCFYRLGERWIDERLQGRREPHLRASVPAARLRLVWADAVDQHRLARALDDFRRDLGMDPASPARRPLHAELPHG